MRLLFDQNLSQRLIAELADVFPGSLHVRLLGMAEADDLSIWNYALAHNLVIVTQDSDFADWHKLRNEAPKIVWLRCGNSSIEKIHAKLRNAAKRIHLLGKDSRVQVVEVW